MRGRSANLCLIVVVGELARLAIASLRDGLKPVLALMLVAYRRLEQHSGLHLAALLEI